MLRLIVAHVLSASLAALRKADLTSAGLALVAMEREQARLRQALERHLPAPPPIALRSIAESHPEHIVHQLLKLITRDYSQPLTLVGCATKLGMNAAYLSALFSRTVGVPFKAYLIDCRMQKARELLGDLAKTVSDVAYAVGYASENRFRIAFKQATGLCPKLWRETMHPNPPGSR